MDEILVKGSDGKWYILKGEELVPIEESGIRNQESGVVELPKGVSEERHARLEVAEVTKEPKVSSVPSVPSGSSVPSHSEHPLKVELEELVDRVVAEVAKEPKVAEVTKDWDEVLRKRFRTIVSARLRDVRDAAETRAMLGRGQKIGGMGFDGELGIRNQESGVIEIIEKAFAEFQAKWRAVENKKIEEWKKKKQERFVPPVVAVAPPRQPTQKPQLARPASEPLLGARPRSSAEGGLPARSASATFLPRPAEVKQPRAVQTTPTPIVGRGEKIRDVRPAPKLLGPVEELASLTLDDFRRLGAVEEAVKKIASRVEVLGAQGLARRLEGIKAWQNSPLHRLYMDLTAAAFAQRKSVDAIITDRQSRNEPTLTSAEFHGIMELNQNLRF